MSEDDPHGPAPSDIVPTSLTAADYLELNDLVGRSVTVRNSAVETNSLTGLPTEVTTTETEDVEVLPPIVTRAGLERAGLRPADVPHLRVIDLPTDEPIEEPTEGDDEDD